MNFDIDRLKYNINYYKENFSNLKFVQVHTWQALKQFQGVFDINNEKFSNMLSNSLNKSNYLLCRRNFHPQKMILYFADKEPEAVREIFINLFNETINLYRRIENFKTKSDLLLAKYSNEKMNKHYQNINVISTYLFLRFPGKYYLYNENKFKAFANNIGYKDFDKNNGFENLKSYYKLCDEILEYIEGDDELVKMSRERFMDLGIEDVNLHLLVQDVIFNTCEIKPLIPKNSYTKLDFLRDTYMEEAQYDSLVRLLNKRKNIIIQGCPGVGKTFVSRLLCYSMMAQKNDSRIKFIQFHPNYSYEDFVMGYRPNKAGFKIKQGIFYNFCKKARKDSENNYFLIIDEINRGNLSNIFGELLMSIENKYRGCNVNLAYNDEEFNVPKNLYIIGLMNTADRSIAVMDYAFRRRFSFFTLEPAFENPRFLEYINGFKNKKLNNLVDTLIALNREIKNDFSLGAGFCIGHSYFFEDELSDEAILDIVEFDLIPLINEYFFEDFDKIEKWTKKLRDSLLGEG